LAREQRKLAAILCADAVGSSRLMGRDESGTVARLLEHLNQRLAPAATRRGGRVVRLKGDGSLIEFASAVDALAAAINFQQTMIEANHDQPDDKAIVFRIGLHLGDIIVEGDDIYGDAVNVAARLEGEAPAGGILISRNVRDAVAGRVKATFEDLGGLPLKNIERPVRAFSVKWEPSDWQHAVTSDVTVASASAPQASLPLPDKPSIAVLPFQNMSGDPEQEYFVDGLVEDIITALSRFKSLFVVARNSSFTYKGRAVDIRLVGRELGVRYVLEGSVRRAANHLRITAQLIESETGAHLWADRFDGAIEDIFQLQDEVTAKVIGSLAPSVERAEIDRSTRKSANLQAYDFFLRGMAASYKMTPKALDDALDFAQQCLTLDPTWARGHMLLSAICHARVVTSSSSDLDVDAAAAKRSARKALELDSNDAVIVMQNAQVLAQMFFRKEEALTLYDKAIELNPNLCLAWALRGMCNGSLGNTARSISDFEQALRLSPRDPLRWLAQHGLAWAHLMAGRYDEALTWAQLVLQFNPNVGITLRVLIAAHAYAGRLDKAREALATHMALEPEARLSTLRASYLRRVSPQAFDTLADGLRKVGFPE
jgi:adenylate cyclase